MRTSGSNTLPFTLGNQFRSIGYSTYAYHDHYWDYYGRDISHPNMGYDYKGRGHGLDVSDLFPESDVEMMELSIPEYVDETPFHVYYMTVSGHMNYTFLDNDMALKHQEEVSDLEYSEETLAYLACNIELDRAIEKLLDELDQAGILEDTVICLTPDHYPYGLDKSCIDELAGHEVEENFELYESTLILWAGDMEETVTVTKPCSSLDILPTLSNLFGLEYDSRLLMGRDILSDSEGLVVFSNRSFLTEHGSYNALTNEFTPYDDEAVPESYARSIMDQVNDMFYYSAVVLDNDYYALLGLSGSGSE
jgi:phosphoglycerol transferase MdoB-like AlkP superfamily enzyme